jgi:hypothetical protein
LHQIDFSWIFLFLRTYPVIDGVIRQKKKKQSLQTGDEEALFKFEETLELIDSGISKCREY